MRRPPRRSAARRNASSPAPRSAAWRRSSRSSPLAATDWLFSLQNNDQGGDFDYGGKAPVDSYDWFLKLGPIANLDKLYFKGSVPQLSAMIEHPDYDEFWKRQRWTDKLGRTTVPTLHVAGFWDQEDPLGTWKIYEKMEAQDPDGLNINDNAGSTHIGGLQAAAVEHGQGGVGQQSPILLAARRRHDAVLHCLQVEDRRAQRGPHRWAPPIRWRRARANP